MFSDTFCTNNLKRMVNRPIQANMEYMSEERGAPRHLQSSWCLSDRHYNSGSKQWAYIWPRLIP